MPRAKAIVAIQFVVPVAVPVGPKLFTHVTLARPPASAAVPEITLEGAVVEMVVADGFKIVNDGAVRSTGAGAGAGAGVGIGAGPGVGVGVGGGAGAGPVDAAPYSVRIAFRSSACNDVAIL